MFSSVVACIAALQLLHPLCAQSAERGVDRFVWQGQSVDLRAALEALPTPLERAKFFANHVDSGFEEKTVSVNNKSYTIVVAHDHDAIYKAWQETKQAISFQLYPLLEGYRMGKDVPWFVNDPSLASSPELERGARVYKCLLDKRASWFSLKEMEWRGDAITPDEDQAYSYLQANIEWVEKKIKDHVQRYFEQGLSKMMAVRQLAEEKKERFRATVEAIAREVGGEAYFGDKRDENGKILSSAIVKSKESTKEKFERLQYQSWSNWPNCALGFNDSMRGTLLVNSVEQMQKSIRALQKRFPRGQIGFSNKFSDDYPDGYVGIHVSILFDGQLVSELQIHLKTIMGPSPLSVQSIVHGPYEISRNIDSRADLSENEKNTILEKCNHANMLYYTQAITAF